MTLSTALAVFELLAGILAGVGLGWALRQAFATVAAPVAPFDREQIQAALMAAREGDADIEALVETLRPRDGEAKEWPKCGECDKSATVRYVWQHHDNWGNTYHKTHFACALHWRTWEGRSSVLASEPIA